MNGRVGGVPDRLGPDSDVDERVEAKRKLRFLLVQILLGVVHAKVAYQGSSSVDAKGARVCAIQPRRLREAKETIFLHRADINS